MANVRAIVGRGLSVVRRIAAAIKRAPGVIRKHLGKLLKLAVSMSVVTILLTSSAAIPEPTVGSPEVSAEWVLPTLAYHYLGRPVEATIKITSPVGVWIDPDSLPQKEETLGVFEIRGRTIRVRYTRDSQITEVIYELQYLNPLDELDEGVFTKRYLPNVYFRFRYRYCLQRAGYVFTSGKRDLVERTEILLLRRVKPGDEPFPLVGPVPEPFTFSVIFKIAGGVTLGAVFLYGLARFIIDRCRKRKQQLLEVAQPKLELSALWVCWQETGDYQYFLSASVFIRDYQKEQLGLQPGELLPKDELWSVTTEALYSGRKFAPPEVEEAFKLFLRIFPEQESNNTE